MKIDIEKVDVQTLVDTLEKAVGATLVRIEVITTDGERGTFSIMPGEIKVQ